MEIEKLVAALREAENAGLTGVPPEEAVDHTFSQAFENRMTRLVRTQRQPAWHMVNTPGKRALMLAMLLLVTFGVRPEQNPLYRLAQPIPTPAAYSAPAATPGARDGEASAQPETRAAPTRARSPLRAPETQGTAEPETEDPCEPAAEAEPARAVAQTAEKKTRSSAAAPVPTEVPATTDAPEPVPAAPAGEPESPRTDQVTFPAAEPEEASAARPAPHYMGAPENSAEPEEPATAYFARGEQDEELVPPEGDVPGTERTPSVLISAPTYTAAELQTGPSGPSP